MNFRTRSFVAGTVVALTAVAGWAQRPYYLMPGLHPSYDSLVSMRPSSMESTGSNAGPNVGGMAWLPDGRLFIAGMSANAPGGDHANRLGESHGYLFSGIPTATSNASVTVTQVSTGYQMPSGAVALGDTIYVLDNEDGLTKLTPDGDGGWVKSVLHKGVLGYINTKSGFGYRTWTGGLAYKDGFFYATVGSAVNRGPSVMTLDDLYRGKGVIYKISKDGSTVDTLAGGVRNPVSMAWGPDAQLFYTDNQGSFMPASAIFHVQQDDFYGHPNTPLEDKFRTPPAIIFPYGSHFTGGTAANPAVANVATDMLMLRDGVYEGQMLVGTNHTPGMNRVFMEKIPTGTPGEYIYQGAVFPFSQGMGLGHGTSGETPQPGVLPDFRTNVNRLSYGPDGRIYLGGGLSPVANGGNAGGGAHAFTGGLPYGLARLVASNDTAFEMKAIRSRSATTLEVEFTEPVNAVTTSNFTVHQGVSVQATSNGYGAGYNAPSAALTVTAAELDADKRRVTLTVTGLKQRPVALTPGSVEDRTWGSLIQVRVTGVTAVSGHSMWQDTTAGKQGLTGWYTLNRFGPGEDVAATTAIARGDAPGVRSGLMLSARSGGILLRAPVDGAYTVRTMNMRGQVLATHNVAVGRRDFLVPTASLARGVTVIEARAANGRRFTATASRL